MFGKTTPKKGFTLLELMLVMGVLVIIAAMSRDFFGSFLGGSQLGVTTSMIKYDLRNARDKAMNGLEDRNWGVHFINGEDDYYQVYSTPTDYYDVGKSISFTYYLDENTSLSNPPEAQSLDIVFNRISGTTTPANIVINADLENAVISVKSQGSIN